MNRCRLCFVHCCQTVSVRSANVKLSSAGDEGGRVSNGHEGLGWSSFGRWLRSLCPWRGCARPGEGVALSPRATVNPDDALTDRPR